MRTPDAELFAVLQAVASNGTATSNALDEAVRVVNATDRDDVRRQVEKLAEFHRLFAVRLATITRQLGERR